MKKILSIITSAVTFMSCSIISANAEIPKYNSDSENMILGDVTGNNKVTYADLSAILHGIAEHSLKYGSLDVKNDETAKSMPEFKNFSAADIDGDGLITTKDAGVLSEYLYIEASGFNVTLHDLATDSSEISKYEDKTISKLEFYNKNSGFTDDAKEVSDLYNYNTSDWKIGFGDLNEDGTIDAKDSAIILSNYADNLVSGKGSIVTSYIAGDYNEDETEDSKDAAAILSDYAKFLLN